MEQDERKLLAAQGYAELGMYDDALVELDALSETARQSSLAIDIRLAVLMQAKRWRTALPISREMCRLHPERNSGYIHTAFCLHEMGETVEARDVLVNGPDTLRGEPTFHYNLACYECALGNLDLASAHLDKSFELDKKFREFAKTDPDLKPLRFR